MRNFIKYPLRTNGKNFQIAVHLKSLSPIYKSFFSTAEQTINPEQKAKTSKYTDNYSLSEEEVKSILKKPAKKPNVYAKTEVERADYKKLYEKTIEDQIGSTRFNTVKEFNTKMEVAQKLEIGTPEIKPSDRPEVKYYKYDLPIPNLDPEIQGLDDIFEREREKVITPNQRVWERLGLDGTASFEAYEKGIQEKFKFELDMYGEATDVAQKRNQQIKALGEEVLPVAKINKESYMEVLRNCFSLNINMPGTLENEDPNKFIRDLRPIEDFRYLPQIPISEKRMDEHKKKIEQYHRGGLYLEVKKETIANYGIFLIFVFIGYNLFTWLMEKEEEIGVNYERMKLRRIQES